MHPISLFSRNPSFEPELLLSQMVPPPRFSKASFSSYVPSMEFPSQQVAKETAQNFSHLNSATEKETGRFRLPRIRQVETDHLPSGIYLDGGFGVGKTHLLVSIFAEASGSKAYTSFSDLTYFVGALGFDPSFKLLSKLNLLCIDEFELDDPGDTVLVSNLCNKLVSEGVRLAATSNTLPERLGEGRFAAEDFLREIQGLKDHFLTVRIDGPDYRKRTFDFTLPNRSDQELIDWAMEKPNSSLDEFDQLLELLLKYHPTRYRSLLSGIEAVGIRAVKPFRDQAAALRFVALVDRMYELEIDFAYSGCSLEELYPPSFMRGGFRKKYGRALSRLAALSN